MERNYRISDQIANQMQKTMNSYGLSTLKAKLYKIDKDSPQYEKEDEMRKQGELNSGYGYFGLPMFDILRFEELSYETQVFDKDGNVSYTTITVPAMDFGVVFIDVSQDKNIVMTSVQGRNGTIKEYISDGDYRISIKGILSENAIDYKPIEKIQKLIKFCKANKEITTTSDLLRDEFGITSIVIKSYSLPQEPDMRNIQKFELVCYSDTPYEIKIKA
jgi:hypothetical protein